MPLRIFPPRPMTATKRRVIRRGCRCVEMLEPRHLLAAEPIITEFMASNGDTLRDGDGNSSDWIELRNAGDVGVDLAGYRLTDSTDHSDAWVLPSVRLDPGQYIVVFASGQQTADYVDAQGNLHTDFRLRGDGEYLALVDPDGKVVSEYSTNGADYPRQFRDVSYGFSQTRKLIDAGSTSYYRIPLDDTLADRWTAVSFDASANGFESGTAAIGFESRPNDRTNFTGEIQTEVPPGTHAVYTRFEFSVDDVSSISVLNLRLKHDNGFVAYLNGSKVAEENAPSILGWFSTAPDNSPRDSDALEFVEFDVTEHIGLLRDGPNVLAIHLLNNSSDDSDLLLVTELVADRPERTSPVGYLATPTPGGPNFSDQTMTGPILLEVTDNPGALANEQDLVVTARLAEHRVAVDSVTLAYRVMFGDEVTVSMVDDGTGADATAADRVYTATIPHEFSSPGEMLRWSVTAVDVDGQTSRAPHALTPETAPEYFGTMIHDPAVSSALPILHWYIEPDNERAADRTSGTRASLFYGDEFYDNVFVRVRGGSSANQPKKSYKFDFNPDHYFAFHPDYERVSEINVNTTYTNKDYVRQALTFETYDAAGAPGSLAFPLRVQRNGEFFSVAMFVEQPDEQLLAREGLDPDGALYKMFNTFTSATNNVEKKTRRGEDNTDLREFIDRVNGLSGVELKNYVYDNVNIPAMLNYLAATAITQNNDQQAKNYYLYRDTNGTGEWLALPWDLDLTFGLHFMTNDSILDDVIWADKDHILGGSGRNVPISPSHPYAGEQEHPGNRSWNRLIDKLYEIPEFRGMYLRRLRSVMDQLLQPPDTPADQLWFEARLDQWAEQLGPDVELDYQAWANPWRWGEDLSMTEAMDRLKQKYLGVRRVHLYQTHSIDNVGTADDVVGIPHGQVGNPLIGIDPDEFDFNPASGNQDEEYVKLNNPNAEAVDISGWRLQGGVDFTFRAGTVIPSGESLYVSPDVAAFRRRGQGPTGGQGLLVQGNYSGHLSNFGETIELLAADGTLISSLTTPVAPSDAQRYLRVTELHYNPDGDDDTEFVELQNISSGADAVSLDLSGVSITDGPAEPFTFSAGTSLAAGQFIVVVKDTTAFQTAYPSVSSTRIGGQFLGSLSNGGERIKLEDATGSTILEFRYSDQWYLDTDGGSFSLTVVDPTASYDVAATWRPSVVAGGSPAAPEPFVLGLGDANRDGIFNQQDVVLVLAGGKYKTSQPATWAEGDWNGDGLFNQLDVVASLQHGRITQRQ